MPNSTRFHPLSVVVAIADRASRWEQYAVLQGVGMQAQMVTNAVELDSYVSDHPDSVVLLDEEFVPGIGSLAARLAIANPGVRILLFARVMNDDAREEARKWGVSDVLPRNPKPDQLRDSIRGLSTEPRPTGGKPRSGEG